MPCQRYCFDKLLIIDYADITLAARCGADVIEMPCHYALSLIRAMMTHRHATDDDAAFFHNSHATLIIATLFRITIDDIISLLAINIAYLIFAAVIRSRFEDFRQPSCRFDIDAIRHLSYALPPLPRLRLRYRLR